LVAISERIRKANARPGVTLEVSRKRLKASLADYKVPSTSKLRKTCRAKIPARSSSAACVIPIGNGRAGGFRSQGVDFRFRRHGGL